MTSGNPAIGHEQGVGAQPYPPGQHPTVQASTLGGVPPDRAPDYRVADAERRVAETVVPPEPVTTQVEDGEHYTTEAEPVTTEAPPSDPVVVDDPPAAPVEDVVEVDPEPAKTGEQGEAGTPASDGPNVTADGAGPDAGEQAITGDAGSTPEPTSKTTSAKGKGGKST